MEKQPVKRIIAESLANAQKGRFIERHALRKALKYLPSKQILSIVGVRRCGKSTLMKQLVRRILKSAPEQNVLYLNLERPFFNQYKEDVSNLQAIYETFLEGADRRKKVYVLLDEIQFFSDWQVFVKWLYERGEAKIVLTGSNSRLLSSELATLLSGRTIPIHMYPFSFEESRLPFDEYLTEGGFPEAVQQPGIRGELAETYYKNTLYQDVIPRFSVQHVQAMENLSYYLLSHPCKEMSYNTLKSISRLDDKTVKEYVSYLQDANLLYLVHNYDFSLKRLIGNKKKVYLVDPLFSRLSFRNSPDRGRLFENFVYMRLRRRGEDVFFHANGGECDFLVKRGYAITAAIQACYELDEKNEEREVHGLLSAMERFSLDEGLIVTRNSNRSFERDGRKVRVVSIKTFVKEFGMDSENSV